MKLNNNLNEVRDILTSLIKLNTSYVYISISGASLRAQSKRRGARLVRWDRWD